jgi:hypothetical protein
MLYQDADDKILEKDIYIDLNEAERIGSSDQCATLSPRSIASAVVMRATATGPLPSASLWNYDDDLGPAAFARDRRYW